MSWRVASTQTTNVYRAEELVKDSIDQANISGNRTVDLYGSRITLQEELRFGDHSGAQRYVDRVMQMGWVRERFPGRAERPVQVGRRAGYNNPVYYDRPRQGSSRISLPDHSNSTGYALRELVVLHELAHHLTLDLEHGAEFLSGYLDLVEQVIGPELRLYLYVTLRGCEAEM